MATTTPSAALIPVTHVFTNTERLALAGFLAAYSGLTRDLEARGRAALSSKGPGGARCKLTPAQLRELEAVLGAGPAAPGWDEGHISGDP